MSAPVPAFPPLSRPESWDDLTALAATIWLEAEGEPYDGQLGVGFVCVNRRDQWQLPLRQVLWGPEGRLYDDGKPYEPISCWNDAYRPMAESRLAAARPVQTAPCWQAAASALWRLVPDPTAGAVYYLNVALTKQVRPDGKLPAWAADPDNARALDARKVRAVIGRHSFLRA